MKAGTTSPKGACVRSAKRQAGSSISAIRAVTSDDRCERVDHQTSHDVLSTRRPELELLRLPDPRGKQTHGHTLPAGKFNPEVIVEVDERACAKALTKPRWTCLPLTLHVHRSQPRLTDRIDVGLDSRSVRRTTPLNQQTEPK